MPIIDTDQLLRTAEERRREAYARANSIKEEADREFNAVMQALGTLLGKPVTKPSAKVVTVTPYTQARVRLNAMLVGPPAPSDPSKPAPDAGLTDCMRWAMKHFDGEFTTPELAEFLEKHGFDMAERRDFMASCMVKLTQKGEVVRVRDGSGRSPGVFRRTDGTNGNGHELRQEVTQATNLIGL